MVPDPSRPDEYEEGMPWGGLYKETYSQVPGAGSYDTQVRKGIKYFRWRGWIENAKGVKERKSLYAPTETALARKIKAFAAEPSKTNTKKLLLGDYLELRFLPGMKQAVRHNTYSTYQTAVKQYIVPEIGKARFASLKPQHVAAWLEGLEIGARSKQLAFATLRRAYSYAVELSLLDRSPLSEMRGPRVPKTEPRILNMAEVKKLLAAAEKTEWYTLVYVAIATGMRQGELFGLTWDAVHLDKSYLRVTRALARTEDGYALGEPKTAASRRSLPLPKDAVTLLRAHRKRQAENPLGLVFTSTDGKPLDGPNFLKRVFRPLLKTAKLPAVTFQSLRHAGNTLLAASGVPLKVLQGRLGHSTSKTTHDVYSHASPSDGKAAADLMGSLLRKKRGTTRGTTRSKADRRGRAATKKKAR